MDEIGFIPEYEEQDEGKEESTPETKVTPVESGVSKTSKLSVKEKKLQQLKKDLDEAVTQEDYEKAAVLRDEIKKIEVSNLN